MTASVSRRALVVAAAALVLSFMAFLIASSGSVPALATHKPADKVMAAGSTAKELAPGTAVTLLSGTLRSSSPSDLILNVSAECSITTDVKTVGDSDQSAEGTVEVWVEIDGEPVGINSMPTSTTSSERPEADDGKVVFCNRAYRRKTSFFDDQEATIETFERTRAANAFNWVALNVGNGIHEVEVKANLTKTATNGDAEAIVGNRTLVIEPAKLANDAGV